MKNKTALVLFSGGQDSTTCLYWAKQNYDSVVALNIDYGQRHVIETQQAGKIAMMANVPYHFLRTDVFSELGDSALIGSGDIKESHRSSESLPASFVPGRNILFLTIAAAWAYKNNIMDIVTGVCQTDYSGYPDCRDNTIKNLQVTLSLAMDFPFTIHAPLMFLTKAESVMLAQSLPGCREALAESHTCYEGKRPGCGICPACILRAKGFEEAGLIDPQYKK